MISIRKFKLLYANVGSSVPIDLPACWRIICEDTFICMAINEIRGRRDLDYQRQYYDKPGLSQGNGFGTGG